jgi:hypothetical protein
VNQKIVYRAVYMTQIVNDALNILREKSPVGGDGDRHPGLYRDSHMVFIDGHVVKDVSGWRPGQQINISNPVPYSRKIETPGFTLSVPGNVYENTAQILAGKYGNSVSVKFVFMPVRFGSVGDYAHSLAGQAAGARRGGSQKALRDWLVRQPALEIRGR